MQAKLGNLWENISASLWFIPSVLAAFALLLSSIMIEVDAALSLQENPVIPWLFSGTADAARTILSVIAGSLITVISIAFSITIVAIVQVSSQFTPRILHQFTSSRPNQIILGAYTATFIYALLVLRAVRSAEEASQNQATVTTSFVPGLSVTVSIILALICLALLIYFIHSVSQSLQVAVILDHARRDCISQFDALYPPLEEHDAERVPEAMLPISSQDFDGAGAIHAEHTGFLRAIDEDALIQLPFDRSRTLRVRPQVGDFITFGSVLVEFDSADDIEDDVAERIRGAFVIDHRRSINQDPLFGVRQIVDIALKALSPGINDMTTAEYGLQHLGDILARLARRQMPPGIETVSGPHTRVIFPRPTWDDFVDAAFSQIRRAAQNDVHVTATLLGVLHELAQRVPAGDRTAALLRQVAEVDEHIQGAALSPADRSALRVRVVQVEETIRSKHEVQPTVTL